MRLDLDQARDLLDALETEWEGTGEQVEQLFALVRSLLEEVVLLRKKLAKLRKAGA